MRQYEAATVLCSVKTVRHKITVAGQISVPAGVRRRWSTDAVFIEDCGDHLVVRPSPVDPIAAARGALKGKVGGRSSEELIRLAREDEQLAEAQRERVWSSWTRKR